MRKKWLDWLTFALLAVLITVFIITGVKLVKNQHASTEAPPYTEPAPTDSAAQPSTESRPTDDAAEPTDSTPPPVEFSAFFENTLFIGDSRTVGLMEYGGITGADFFATSGMSVYNIASEKVSMPGVGVLSLDTLLESKKYDKIYIMLGINELGYRFEQTVDRYEELVDKIQQSQPQALIVIQANLHVSAKRSQTDEVFNNTNINRYNQALGELALRKGTQYLDVNSLFDDENGDLDAKYTKDNTHILAKYYVGWAQWLYEQSLTFT